MTKRRLNIDSDPSTGIGIRIRRSRHAYRAVGHRGRFGQLVPVVLVHDEVQDRRDG
jgi:hypothetical protein